MRTSYLSLANYFPSSSNSVFSGSSSQKSTESIAEKVAAITQENTAFLTKNSKGKSSMPTVELLDAAVTPLQKLQAAYRVGAATKVYTDAASQTGIVTRLSSMKGQVEKVTATLGAAVEGLKRNGGLKSSQNLINNTVTTVQTIIGQMNRLAGKLPASEASSLKSAMATLDTSLQKTANAAGLKYTSPITGKGNVSTSAVSAKSNRLLDYLA